MVNFPVFSTMFYKRLLPWHRLIIVGASGVQESGSPVQIRSKDQLFSKPALVFTCQQYQSFENTVGNGEISRKEQVLLLPQCFLPVWKIVCHFNQIWNCRLQSLSVWKGLKLVVWERVKTPSPWHQLAPVGLPVYRRGGLRFESDAQPISVRGLILVIATGSLIPHSPIVIVLTMVMWESSQCIEIKKKKCEKYWQLAKETYLNRW